MFKRNGLAEVSNVNSTAAEMKKQRAKEEKQRSKQIRKAIRKGRRAERPPYQKTPCA